MTSKIPLEMKVYKDKSENSHFAVEISFMGGTEQSKGHPLSTNVEIRLFKKEEHQSVEVWTKNLGDPTMPNGAWNGFKLVQILSDKMIAGVSNRLLCLDILDGNIEWEIETGNTSVNYILISPQQDQIIVQNEYYKFHHPEGLSNISAYNLEGKEIWRSQLENGDVFANSPHYEDGFIYANTWNCFKCQIDSRNGKILSKGFTK